MRATCERTTEIANKLRLVTFWGNTIKHWLNINFGRSETYEKDKYSNHKPNNIDHVINVKSI